MATQNLAPLIVICGQTATGKSDLAMKLARKYNGEIICADSRTIYSGMDIGTAKPSSQDRRAIEHYLLDIIEPDQTFSVAEFKKLALAAIDKISKKGKLPILVGGSGLYIDALIFDYGFGGRNDDKKLRENTLILGLKLPREELKIRIQKRARQMIKAGLVAEAKVLSRKYGWHPPAGGESMNTPEYRATKKHLAMNTNIGEFAADITKGDLALAKKQLTWFKRNKNIHWVNDFRGADSLVSSFVPKFDTIDL